MGGLTKLVSSQRNGKQAGAPELADDSLRKQLIQLEGDVIKEANPISKLCLDLQKMDVPPTSSCRDAALQNITTGYMNSAYEKYVAELQSDSLTHPPQ